MVNLVTLHQIWGQVYFHEYQYEYIAGGWEQVWVQVHC